MACQVTLEIDTNPQKVQESSTEIKQMQDGSNETTAEKREDNIAESFQIPAELLE